MTSRSRANAATGSCNFLTMATYTQVSNQTDLPAFGNGIYHQCDQEPT